MLPRARLLVAALLLAACRHGDDAKLDDVMKMAYGVKPSVVRISAYATAQFSYDSGTAVIPSVSEGPAVYKSRSLFSPAAAGSFGMTNQET